MRQILIRFGSFHARTSRGLQLSTRRFGYPRQGTCLSGHPFQTDQIFRVPQVIAASRRGHFSVSFSKHGYCAFEVLASTAVQRLIIPIVDVSKPNEHFPQLATRLPHLEALHIPSLCSSTTLCVKKLRFPSVMIHPC